MKEFEDEDQNNGDVSDNTYSNNINNNNFNKNSSTNSEIDIRRIYEENKRQNKMKIDTSEFLSFSLKVELLFQTLQSYLYWISTIEFVIFLVLFFMYCSSPKNLGKIWWYIFHFFRGIIGLIIIFYLPKTYQIIDNLREIPDILDKLKSDLIRSFFDLLQPQKKKLKMFLMCYFTLTMLCTVIDIMMFCVFAPDIGIVENGKPFFFMLLSSIIFIYTDFIYFSFFSSFKFYFNKKQHDDIQRATIIGFFDQLKIGMAKGVVRVTKTIGKVAGDIGTAGKNLKNPFSNNSNKKEIRDVNVMN
jgi:hypothetical protein